MDKQDIFIGRQAELNRIKEIVNDSPKQYVLRFVAPGGQGKTWLLREVYRHYSNDPDVVVIRIDYSETRFHNMMAVYVHVMEQFDQYLSEEQKRAYRSKLTEWAQTTGVDFDTIEEDTVYRFGVDLVNTNIASKKRIVILIDTVEVILDLLSRYDDESSFSKKRINKFLFQIHNAIAIVTARPNQKVRREFENKEFILGWHIYDTEELQPFSWQEASEYLDKVLSSKIADELKEKVFLLTGYKPVLIAIAGEWLKQDVSLPPDIALPLENLLALDETELQKRRESFEFELMKEIRLFRTRVSRAMVYMSYLDRRYDPKILQLTMKIDNDEELNALVKELQNMVFVRKSMITEEGLLHDEVKRLIRKHVLHVVDPTDDIRKEIVQKVIDEYYLPKIQDLNDIVRKKSTESAEYKLEDPENRVLNPIPDENWLKQELQVECLYYHLRISQEKGFQYLDQLSQEKGFQYLDQLIDEAINYRFSRIFINTLQQAIQNLIDDELLQTPPFQVRLAQLLFAKEERQEADKLAELALSNINITLEDAIIALDIRNDCSSDPIEKIVHLEEALKKAQILGDTEKQALIYNSLGLAYRRQGKWDKAEEFYKEVLKLQNKEQFPTQYANTLNNLAFVCLLQGDVDQADNIAEQALRIRKKQGDRLGIAFSYATMARITKEMGSYDLSMNYTQTAIELFDSIGDENSIALLQINIAGFERHLKHFDQANRSNSAGLQSENPYIRAHALYEQAKIERDQARFMKNQEELIYEIHAKYKNALIYTQDALELARKIQEDHLVASILFEQALIAFLKNGSEDKVSIEALEKLVEDYNYIQERGQLIELKGDLEYIKGHIEVAFEYYLTACEVLSEYTPTVFRRTFRRVRDRFLDMPTDKQKNICRLINERLTKVSFNPKLIILKKLCDDHNNL